MKESDRLLLNVLPASISARLRDGEQTIADEYPSVSVLFADIVGFTPLAARLQRRRGGRAPGPPVRALRRAGG